MRTALVVAIGLVVGACGRHEPPPPPPAPPEHINAAGLTLIKDIETLKLKPYKFDGQWYVGYGHALEKPVPAITEAEAEHLLRKDLAICEDAIRQTVTVPVNDNEFSAMASLCYTLGVPKFVDTSVIKRLNAGDRRGAGQAFMLFDKAENAEGEIRTLSILKERRRKERDLFLTPPETASSGTES